MKDHWKTMYADPYAVRRVKRSCKLLIKWAPRTQMVVSELGSFQELARIFLPADYVYYPFDQEPFTKNTIITDLNQPFNLFSCQAILCLEVLEHVIDPEKVIKQAAQSLTLDGILVISLPNEATLFHRLRAFTGTVDAECFSSHGKHLHLPSFKQARKFMSTLGRIVDTHHYINPSATGSRQGRWLGPLMKLVPDSIWQWLADLLPGLFARGWIFVLKPYRPRTRPQNEQASDYKPAA